MKQISKTIFLLFVISSFSFVNAQTSVKNKSAVHSKESLTTEKDSTGIHEITTIQKDSIVGDSIYSIKTVRNKTVAFKGGSKVTTEITSTIQVKAKK